MKRIRWYDDDVLLENKNENNGHRIINKTNNVMRGRISRLFIRVVHNCLPRKLNSEYTNSKLLFIAVTSRRARQSVNCGSFLRIYLVDLQQRQEYIAPSFRLNIPLQPNWFSSRGQQLHENRCFRSQVVMDNILEGTLKREKIKSKTCRIASRQYHILFLRIYEKSQVL